MTRRIARRHQRASFRTGLGLALGADVGEESDAEVDTQAVCIDEKRQWSRWRNVWHSSATRSKLYMLGAPLRRAKRLFA